MTARWFLDLAEVVGVTVLFAGICAAFVAAGEWFRRHRASWVQGTEQEQQARKARFS